ncbi:AfsR/SARP family transcriptional regulator [Jatrophihabitans sp.]|uniref:AfsR/SARP family transcriptional regulator n=1 Tax=Jatrophihabitans sp. TaxID=1932789 RepID=UPI002B73BF75|nr:BTAD domain-containing putative transcriptional regulator [Jatrophihabitans sp.]
MRIRSGTELSTPSPKLARTLLGILALRANTTVSAGWVQDALWGDRAPKSAASNLRSYLAELRRALGRAEVAVDIDSGPAGYRLHATPETLDSLLFESLTAQGRSMLAVGRPAAAADLFARAGRLWRGPVLDATIAPQAVRPEIEALHVKRLNAIEDGIEAGLALGRHRALVGELTDLVTRWPLRERLCGQLMLALYRSGQQVEALRAYQALRHRMDEELGVAPFAEIQALHRRILQADTTLAFPLAVTGIGRAV